jgi:hypothetical protein
MTVPGCVSLGSRGAYVRRSLIIAVVVLAAIYVVAFLAVAAARLGYPYEVDPLEGNLLAMTLRVLHGEPLYARPSIDYAAFCYAPLYFYVTAMVMRVLGPGYAALRLVSVMATLATSATLYTVLRKDGVHRWLAIASIAVFVGCHARTHYAGDVGRVDALALALALGGLGLAFQGSSLLSAALAGGLGGLAILTKQPMAILVTSAAVVQLASGRRLRGLVFLATTGATLIAVLAWMGLLGDRWLTFYCLAVPASHPLRVWDLAVLGPAFLVTTLPIALVAPLSDAHRRRAWISDPWTVVTILYAGFALLARAKVGGAANVFLPVTALAAIQLGRYLERIRGRRPLASLGLLAGQLALLWWSPLAVWPTAQDVRQGDRLVAQIAELPGDVYVPAFPAYANRAGKPWHAHYVALCDLRALVPALENELADQLASHRFAAVLPVADVEGEAGNPCALPGLVDHYRRTATISTSKAASDLASLLGGPQLFELVHAGKLGALFQPR